MLVTDIAVGFIIVDGNGALFAIVRGSSREVLKSISVDLPKKHNKGGYSAPRFARLRMEKRHNYLRKVIILGFTLKKKKKIRVQK